MCLIEDSASAEVRHVYLGEPLYGPQAMRTHTSSAFPMPACNLHPIDVSDVHPTEEHRVLPTPACARFSPSELPKFSPIMVKLTAPVVGPCPRVMLLTMGGL